MCIEFKTETGATLASNSRSGTSPQGRGVSIFKTESAPWLQEISVDKLITFKRAYELYVKELRIATSAYGSSVVPYTMADCVEDKSVKTICTYEGDTMRGVTATTLTDNELEQFVQEEISMSYTTQTAISSLEELGKRYLEYDMNVAVRARVFHLFASYREMIAVENLTKRFEGKNAKKIGKLLCAALKPESLRKSVEVYCVEVLNSEPFNTLEADGRQNSN